MLPPGFAIERYEVVRLLGKGGMAAVYLVRHRQLGSLHALKVLTLQQEGIRERMLQEGQLQARLKHPNIVEVRDVLDVEGAPGLLMEYVPGPTLEALLQERRLGYEEAERLFRGIVSGMAHAHANNLVHRDLKPANVLLPEVNGTPVPKVADFGLARLIGESSSMTQTGIVMGTPPYMSPEQIEDPRSVDHRADIFALGCILYEMVCGASPFRREQWMQTFQAVVSGNYPAPETLAPNLPRHLAATIAGCLRTDRAERLADCDAILRTLDQVPAEYRPPRGRRMSALFVAATGVGMAGSLGLAALVGGAFWWMRGEKAVVVEATLPAEAASVAPDTPPPVEPPLSEPERAAPVRPSGPRVAADRPRAPVPAVTTPTAERPLTSGASTTIALPPATTVATGPGQVVVSGDVTDVWLVGNGKQHAGGGELPPGFYRILASFTGGSPVLAGDVRLEPGERITVTCSTANARCQVSR